MLPKEHCASLGETVDLVSTGQRLALLTAAVHSALWHDLASSLTPAGSAFEGVMHWDSRNAWSGDAPQPGIGVSIAVSTQLAPTVGLSFCSPEWSGCTLLGNLDVPLGLVRGASPPFLCTSFHSLCLFSHSAWSLSLLHLFVVSDRTGYRC